VTLSSTGSMFVPEALAAAGSVWCRYFLLVDSEIAELQSLVEV